MTFFFLSLAFFSNSQAGSEENIYYKRINLRKNKFFFESSRKSVLIIFASKHSNQATLSLLEKNVTKKITLNESFSLPAIIRNKRVMIQDRKSNLDIVTWKLPSKFCSSFFLIKSYGEFEGQTVNGVHHNYPMCIFSDPFMENFKLSAQITNVNEKDYSSIAFYVDSSHEPFLSCDCNTECLFLHSKPFFMRIQGPSYSEPVYSIRYQSESKKSQKKDCLIHPINSVQLNSTYNANVFQNEFQYECKDEIKENAEHVQIAILIFAVFLLIIILLHYLNCINIYSFTGCEDEEIRFMKAAGNIKTLKEDL